MADSLIRMQFEGSETNLEKLPTQASASINQSDAEQSREEEYANCGAFSINCFNKRLF